MKLLVGFLIASVSVVLAAQVVTHFWQGPTLTASKVRERWGDAKFNADKFKKGNPREKSTMAYSLLKSGDHFRGMKTAQIRAELGNPDGFYFRDSFPAYIIDETENDTWQIVFLLNNKFKVSNIIVHRNCCDSQ